MAAFLYTIELADGRSICQFGTRMVRIRSRVYGTGSSETQRIFVSELRVNDQLIVGDHPVIVKSKIKVPYTRPPKEAYGMEPRSDDGQIL